MSANKNILDAKKEKRIHIVLSYIVYCVME